MAWERIALKRDRHGMYSSAGGASWTFSELTKNELTAHFAGEITLGCGSTSVDDQCLWVAWDLDNHVSDVATNQNLKFAIVLLNRLAELGVRAIIEDSDGKGGIHVWAFFSEPVPAADAHRFSKWIARDYSEHGLADCECFPKSPTVQYTREKCGTYLRVPGKHHKREHWSRIWGDGEWLNAEDSIQMLLDAPANSPVCLVHAPKEQLRPAQEYNGPETDAQERIRTALPYIRSDDYDIWLRVGQALHSEGDHLLDDWIYWSSSSDKFSHRECDEKWKTFSRDGKVRLGTVFHLAADAGWQRPRVSPEQDFSGITCSGEQVFDSSETKPPEFWKLKSAWAAVEKPAPKREVVIEGLVRRGEVANIIASTKVGKSWLALLLGMRVASGEQWLGHQTTKGRVLLIDNELHDEEIQNRMANVANAASISTGTADPFEYVDLRGKWAGIREIEHQLSRFKPGELTLVVLDAKYRFFSNGMSENSNDDQTAFHNAIDRLARRLNCAIVMVHHATKGDQGQKAVTDIGSGGGSQSRAADCHIVIRPHDGGDDLAVLDAAVRSFPPVEPQTIRWSFPLWTADEFVQPVVKQQKSRNAVQVASATKDNALVILDILRHEPGQIASENKLSGSHPARKSFRAAIRELENEERISFDADFQAPRSKKPTGGWQLLESDGEVKI